MWTSHEFDNERSTLADLAYGVDRAAMADDDFLDGRKTDTRGTAQHDCFLTFEICHMDLQNIQVISGKLEASLLLHYYCGPDKCFALSRTTPHDIARGSDFVNLPPCRRPVGESPLSAR